MLTSKERLYQELVLSLFNIDAGFVKFSRSARSSKISLPVIFMSYYLLKPPLTIQYRLTIYPFFSFFKNSFFPSAVIEWIRLDSFIWNAKSLHIFKKSILQFKRLSPSRTDNSFNTKGIKHLTRLRLWLSHLCDRKVKHGFLDSLNPICSCGLDIETTCHY